MKRLNGLLLTTLMSVGVLTVLNSCKKVDPPANSDSTISMDYQSSPLIVNEGNFGSGNGSISFYSSTYDKMFNNIFSKVNNRPLGDVVQSVTKSGGSTYICVNVSNKIEVVNSTTFKEEATITGVSQPRYMVANGSTGYVSSWNGIVAMLDLTTNTITGTIPVGAGPEKMVINNNNLYVANSGGYGKDSTISVIDLSTNTVSTTITINGYNPTAIVNGIGNTIWVLAKGKVIYDGNWNVVGHDPSKLIEINTSNNTVVSTTTLFATSHPNNIAISPSGATLYFGGSWGFPAIYTVNTSNPSTPTSPFISESNYGFFVNSSNGNLFILQEASSSNGKLLRYNDSGTKLGEYTVGVFPNGGASRIAK
jgi:DNA-binding beta-propeller fold protein YncE